MNTKEILIAMLVALASVGAARAEGINIDFDGKKAAGFISAASMKEELATVIAVPAAEPVQDESKESEEGTVKIKTVIKSGTETREELLTCKRGFGKDRIEDCKKSDSSPVSAPEVNSLALRQYLSPETLKFVDLLNQTKHSYTNQSGPQTFSCNDTCARYVPSTLHLPYGINVDVPVSFVCEEWTHECECVAGCY
jgi:hypothetical protein